MNATAPWLATLTETQYLLTFYFLALGMLVLLAGLVRTAVVQREVGSRYRSATVARLCVHAVALLSYVALTITLALSYTPTPEGRVPTDLAIGLSALRYIDWSVTVPLLTIELIAVCAVSGIALRRLRVFAVSGAFLMIFTGFLGAVLVQEGGQLTQLLLWGAVSSVFWIAVNVMLIRAVVRSFAALTAEAGRLLRNATIILLGGWVVYPVVYLLPLIGLSGSITTTMQIAFCVADLIIKVGFGGIVHRIAKLRTAEDVRSGIDVHPESIWISSLKQADAGTARGVYLADGAEVHSPRSKPPISSAVAADPADPVEDYEH